MSMTLFCLLAVAVFSSEAQGDQLVAPDAAVSQLLDKYIKASGGEALLKVETETRKGTLIRGKAGKVPLTTFAKSPDRWRYNQVFAWGDQINYGFDGTSAWMVDMESINQLNPRQQLDFQLIFGIRAPLELTKLYPKMKAEGSRVIGDKEAAIIIAQSADGFSTELAFDPNTGLLLRAGKIHFEDYRKTEDIFLPYKITLGDTGEARPQMVMQFDEITHGVELEDSLFEKPQCVLRPAPPPLHKDRTRVELDTKLLDTFVGIYRHPTDTTVTYTVSRQDNHLMIGVTGSGSKIEIKPESETGFFITFPDQGLHFVRDSSGNVTHLVFDANSTKAWLKIQ